MSIPRCIVMEFQTHLVNDNIKDFDWECFWRLQWKIASWECCLPSLLNIIFPRGLWLDDYICVSCFCFEEIALVFDSDLDSYSCLALHFFPPFSFVYCAVGFLGILGDRLGNQLTTISMRLYLQQRTIGVLS